MYLNLRLFNQNWEGTVNPDRKHIVRFLVSIVLLVLFSSWFTAANAQDKDERPVSSFANEYDLGINSIVLGRIFSEYVATRKYNKYPDYLQTLATLELYKWEKQINFVVHNSTASAFTENIVSQISKLISNVNLISSDEDIDKHIESSIFGSETIDIFIIKNYEDFIVNNSEILFWGPEGKYEIPHSDFMAVPRNRFCHSAFYLRNRSISSAIYVGNADAPVDVQNKCMAMFIYRSLGVFGSNFVRYDSIINPNSNEIALSDIDKDIIRALYSPKVVSGDSLKKFEAAISSITLK